MNVDGHDTPPIFIYISLNACSRSQYNKYGKVTQNIQQISEFAMPGKGTAYRRGLLLTPLLAPTMALTTANGPYWHYL
jgi:hypothetical protein